MPYVASDGNRYLGEHTCGIHHYGDHSMVRECCIEDARKARRQRDRVAFTESHPASVLARAAWDSLTDAERAIVGPLPTLSAWG